LEQNYIDRERDVILREMQEVESHTEEVIFEQLHSVAFQETSYGQTILGPEQNIKSITKEQLHNYISTHYTAPRVVVVASGEVNHDDLVKLTEKSFSGLPSTIAAPIPSRPVYTGSGVLIRQDDMPDAHVAFGFEGVGWSHPDYFTFLVIQAIIGNWDRNVGGSANLISHMAEILSERDLASSFMSFTTPYHTTGLFGIYAVTNNNKIEDCSRAIFTELSRLGLYVTPGEVERSKNKLKSSFLMQLDGTTAIAEDIGRQLLTIDRRMNLAEIFLRINDITADDVKRVVYKYCYNVDPSVSAIGQIENLPDYNHLRTWTLWQFA